VDKKAELTKPAGIHWAVGFENERERLYAEVFTNGTFIS
jgi:hypothetical protein